MARVNRELLPSGREINHDGSLLKVIKRLKAGLTGEVYEGSLTLSDQKTPVHVAVKAMKTLEFPAARQFFLQESETLAFLMHLEEEANREQGLDLKIAPKYYGRGEYQENPYLVMEFIEGKEIPDLLKDLEGGKFPEKQALTIAWHLYRTLDVLHRLLRKTYIDLKFENLWWVNGTEQLKLTDFGTLEEIQSGDMQRRGVLRDLLLAAVYFCKMATGYTPNYSLGELKEFGELKKNVQNANISWGTKRELKRLLHRNPVQRPVDASDVAARLRTLVDFWSRDEDKVLEIARKSLDRAQTAYDDANTHKKPISEEGLNSAYRARSAFEIVNLRSPDVDIAYDNERLDVILKAADHLERGKNLLRGRSYTLAKQVFQEGMEWGEDSATLRRWAYLAEIGEAISPTDFEAIQDKAFAMLDDLFAGGAWDASLEQLEKIQSVLSAKNIPVGLSSLFSEARLFFEIKKADDAFENGTFEDAAKHYRDANTYLEALPAFYQKFIRDTELGDLEKSAMDMDAIILRNQQKFAANADYNQAIEYVVEGKDKEALALAEKAYRASYALDYNLARLSEVTHAALGGNNYNLAFDLAQIALLCGSIPKILKDDLDLAKNLNLASQALDIPDSDQFYEGCIGTFESSESPSLANDCIKDLLDKAEKKAEISEDANLYGKVSEVSEKVGEIARANDLKLKAEEIYKKKSNERHAKVDELIVEANILGSFKPNPFDDTTQEQWNSYSISDTARILHTAEERYKYVEEILLRAAVLVHMDDYRLEEIKDDQEKVKDFLSSAVEFASSSVEAQKKQYEKDLHALNYWWTKIEPLLQWRERSKQVFGDSKASQSIYGQLYGETSDFLTACYAVLQGQKTQKLGEKQNESPIEGETVGISEGAAIHVLIANAQKVLNSLGPDAWRSMKRDAEIAISKADSLLSDAKGAFATGDLPLMQSKLDQASSIAGGTQEWRTLHSKLMRVILWKKWQDENFEKFSLPEYHPDLLKMIRSYTEEKLPTPYWTGSSAESYLKRVDDDLQAKSAGEISRYKYADFIDMLKKWLDVSWTSRLASSSEAHNPLWNAKAWLDSVYPAVLGKDVAKLVALVHGTSIPEQVDQALESINLNIWHSIINREESERKKAEERLSRIKNITLFASAAVVVFCMMLAFVAFLYRAPIGILINGTYTPTASMTPTATPTFPATPTFSPTPTLTPTPLTSSRYLIPDPRAVYPVIPNAVEFAWIIPPEVATAEPALSDAATWTKEISTDPNANNEVFYSTQKAVLLFWTTDQPLPGGWYAIYVADTKSKSGGFGSQSYNISSTGQPLLPFRGQSSVVFNTEALGQKSDEWLALGVYEIPDGQTVEVKTVVPPLTGNASFSLGKLLIVKITDPQKNLYDSLPSERVLFSLSDDTSAVVLNTENMGLINPDYQGQSVMDANLNSWGGSFRSLGVDSLNGISNKVSVQWHSAGRLPAGKYQLMVWIPANGASATGEFSMLLNGKPVDKQTLPIINQADHPGQWWVVDMWNLPEEGSANILFTVNAAENAGKFIGIDALALVKVE
jgi:serine/threonine protein kinase